jgi:uncharacterized DUF497 family protein
MLLTPGEFRWNEWNLDHATRHGVMPEEAEHVVLNARRPYPEVIGEGKLLVIGPGVEGRFVQVIFVLDEDRTAYIIHARPLITRSDKRRYRRRIP